MVSIGTGSGSSIFPSWFFPNRTPRAVVTVLVQNGGAEPQEGATVLICPYQLSGVTGIDGTVVFSSVPIGIIQIKAAKVGVGYVADSSQNLTEAGLGRTLTLSQAYQAPTCPA